MSDQKTGKLSIVGTPIGNLGDITIRAIETLKKCDMILAEDTRQTLKLLNHFGVTKHMISYHRHNEAEKIKKVEELLKLGKHLCLVSDAGMPIISDPGQNLVKYLVENHYELEVVPGVTALTTAIVKSGMDSTRFTFEGFLSVNKKQRRKRLESLKREERTMIFYEAPHKILETLKDMLKAWGNRRICIARELTKIYEEFVYTTFQEAIEQVEEKGIRGEIVLLIEGMPEEALEAIKKEQIEEKSNKELVEELMEQGISKKEAIKKIAKLKDVHKNEVYQDCMEGSLKFLGEIEKE